MHTLPLAYFLTFRAYGTWLPGDERGSTKRRPTEGTTHHTPNPALRTHANRSQKDDTYFFSEVARRIVHASIQRTCEQAEMRLLEINVRTNHVHAVVSTQKTPERTMSSLKAWATRALREQGLAGADQKVWSRHGSTIYLFTERELEYAMWYTAQAQAQAQDGVRFDMPDQ